MGNRKLWHEFMGRRRQHEQLHAGVEHFYLEDYKIRLSSVSETDERLAAVEGPADKVFFDISNIGNTVSCCIPIALRRSTPFGSYKGLRPAYWKTPQIAVQPPSAAKFIPVT